MKPYTHLIDIKQLHISELLHLLDKAQTFKNEYSSGKRQYDLLKDMTIVNLFFEPSTRTRISFEIAAKRLSATIINFDLDNSSAQKGETILDTIYTLQAMDCQMFVIRHKETDMASWLAKQLIKPAAIINAGTGSISHPTQALLDTLTIKQHKKNFEKLKVVIIGDIIHSRVATSLIEALTLLQTKEICLVGPENLLPEHPPLKTSCHLKLEPTLKDADVIVALRLQKERMETFMVDSIQSFHMKYGLTEARVSLAKPDVIVLHPGPMNRDIEIDDKVADGPHSVILDQVNNGIFIRMAVLDYLKSKLYEAKA